ncbi:hypothetical protein QWT87_03610 [Chryseobacterium sp. APV1]|uniref:Uncharacterized protein n=1 Tax=Chryseobacterium urinae TaxID=3058400 RepID=A0ABT8TYU0_9FLAO|nr:hypothetical protein [Chryseobacterium sp. APV1]MDO3423964.1 hypothetical protein [Chryseobacterium sp. APV1]
MKSRRNITNSIVPPWKRLKNLKIKNKIMKKIFISLLLFLTIIEISAQKCFYNDNDVQEYLSQNVTLYFSNSGGVFSKGTVGSKMYYLEKVTLLSYTKAVITYYDYQNSNSIVKVLINCAENTLTDVYDGNKFKRTSDIENDLTKVPVNKSTVKKRR